MRGRDLVVWQLADGKRGHERQAEGLIDALGRRVPLTRHRIALGGRPAPLWQWLSARFEPGAGLPAPDLIVGAGRATQVPLLAARRARGGRSICLMRPGLPLGWFDLCVVPKHDGVAARDGVVLTEGVLNPVVPAATKDPELALVLLGGPSAHHDFDVADVVAQVAALLAAAPARNWVITDSRRSPPALGAALGRRPELAARYRPFTATAPDWLPATLARASVAHVSADSVAMLYEALTAGAAVGLIAVTPKRADRISAIGPALVARGWVAAPGAAPAGPVALDEAGRVADLLLDRWPELGGRAVNA